MEYQETIDKIKSLEIQGAEKIAIAAVKAFAIKLAETKDKTKLTQYYEELKATRPTEPALRNALRYCLDNYESNPNVIDFVINHFSKSKETIAKYGAKKIQDGMIVFTHCHSSTVEAIIIEAKMQGKNFEVYNTETRPRFQGRITAKNLAKHGIPVTHFVDSAGRSMMRKADIFLFGCDAITSEGNLINKIGTEMLASEARNCKIPAYSCTNSWKFEAKTIFGYEEKIEERNTNEVWENPDKGIKIYNPAFEITPPDMFSGIITEIGVYKPESLVQSIKQEYPWMIK